MPKLIQRIRLFLVGHTATPEEKTSTLFIASSDFKAGDRLCVYGRYVFKHDPTGQLPVVFLARRNIEAGESVSGDPTDPERTDLTVIVGEIDDK